MYCYETISAAETFDNIPINYVQLCHDAKQLVRKKHDCSLFSSRFVSVGFYEQMLLLSLTPMMGREFFNFPSDVFEYAFGSRLVSFPKWKVLALDNSCACDVIPAVWYV